jgi:hypothetical protein
MKAHPNLLPALKGVAMVSLALGCLARADEMAAPKPYILYLGADLSIERDGGLHPVRNVNGKFFVIEVNGKEVRVPMAGDAAKTALKESLKLTEASAAVANLKYKQTYTPANDPDLDRPSSAMMSQAVLDTGSPAPSSSASGAQLQNGVGMTPNQGMGSQTAASNGEGASAISSLGQQIESGSNGFNTDRSGAPAEGDFDAIDLSFEVSADHALPGPYMIVIVRYRDPKGKPDAEYNWIHAERIDPITSKPEKIHFTGAGFSLGYQIESVQVHIYQGGVEVATNVSPKRMALSRDQAFMYLTFDYLNSHKGATLPATPDWQTLTERIRARIPKAMLDQTVYVKVSKEGNAGGTFVDADCTRKVGDPDLDSALQELHFNPALLNGAPVAGVAEFRLARQPI